MPRVQPAYSLVLTALLLAACSNAGAPPIGSRTVSPSVTAALPAATLLPSAVVDRAPSPAPTTVPATATPVIPNTATATAAASSTAIVQATGPAALSPSAIPTATTARLSVAPLTLPSRVSLGPLINIVQTWNNCGPATVAEMLRYWGVTRSQAQAQAVLRADGNGGGMVLYGVPAYVRSLGLETLIGVGGNDMIIKALVANGFPVIVSQWVSASDRTAR